MLVPSAAVNNYVMSSPPKTSSKDPNNALKSINIASLKKQDIKILQKCKWLSLIVS